MPPVEQPTASRAERAMAEQVTSVRAFNRFYTARLGLLRRRHLDGEFPLTEARILYEIGSNPGITASALCGILELDAGYVSRLLRALTRRRLLRQDVSKHDGREKHLTLTASGEQAVLRLDRQSDEQIKNMLGQLNPIDREGIAHSLQHVQSLLAERRGGAVRVERVARVGPAVLALLEEYYEAVHVVLRDKPAAVRKILAEPGSGIWLGSFNGNPVGCVMLRSLSSVPGAAECKRLYVKPSARGQGIADRLLDGMEEHAQAQGYAWIYLDTHDGLKAAIALYERRGYQRCERYNQNPQATVFMRKRIGPQS